MRKDGSSFDDHAVHRVLRRNGVHNPEGEWFRKVTGLTLKDFSLLVSLNVFNSEMMNDAVYKFKRYEDDTTTGIIEDTPTHDGVSESPMTSDETVAVKSWTELTIGDTVTHKSLGPGTVMSFNEKYIIIKFRDRESKFIYPGAFEKGYFE